MQIDERGRLLGGRRLSRGQPQRVQCYLRGAGQQESARGGDLAESASYATRSGIPPNQSPFDQLSDKRGTRRGREEVRRRHGTRPQDTLLTWRRGRRLV